MPDPNPHFPELPLPTTGIETHLPYPTVSLSLDRRRTYQPCACKKGSVLSSVPLSKLAMSVLRSMLEPESTARGTFSLTDDRYEDLAALPHT